MTSTDASPFPSLFSHRLRKDWGVGILSGETDGKRKYLFETGDERTLANGFHDLMLKVEHPSADQLAAYARLRGVLAARAPAGAATKGWTFMEQLTRFHESYPGGLSDPTWASDLRGESADERTPRHRQAMIGEAKERLSAEALDPLLAKQQYAQVWEQAVTVLRHTDLVPAAQLKQKQASAEHLRVLAPALRELLHGTGAYEQRFDRFLGAFAAAFGAFPRWELATAFSALVHPAEHVCVESTAFRKQLKASARRAVATQPSSAGYTSFLGVARLVANHLAEQGELPRDLFDARDFIVVTNKPVPKARPSRAKAKSAKRSEPPADAADDD